MGLFEALNKKSGYSEENMIKIFDEFLPAMGSQALCSLGVSFKTKVLFNSKVIGSGFAAITNTNLLVTYMIIPIKGIGMYDFNSPKKLLIKKHMGNKVLEAKLFNIYTQEFDNLILEIPPSLAGFPTQQSNMEYFITILESHVTE